MSARKLAYVRTFSELSAAEKEFVYRESEAAKEVSAKALEEFGQQWRFLGLRIGDRLTSFISFRKQEERCMINRIWGEAPKDFIQTHKTTPALFLMEDLVRQRAKTFILNGVTKKGDAFFERNIRAGLLKRTQVPEVALGLGVTPKFHSLAKGRKPLR